MEILYALGTVAGVYTGFLVGGGLWQNLASERITSQNQLERIAEEEADKLGLDKQRIIPEFYDKGHQDYDQIRGAKITRAYFDLDNEEWISRDDIDGKRVSSVSLLKIKEGWGASRGAVAHELYHDKKHLPGTDGIGQKLKWFFQEPAAILYAITGLETV